MKKTFKKKEQKAKFPQVFSGGLGRYYKMFAKYELPENVTSVFKKKSNLHFIESNQQWIRSTWGYRDTFKSWIHQIGFPSEEENKRNLSVWISPLDLMMCW